MKRTHPTGFPEAAILAVMPYRKPMTVKEIQAAAHAHAYSGVRALLEALEQAGWVESVLRRPRTGRPALAWKRIAALPR